MHIIYSRYKGSRPKKLIFLADVSAKRGGAKPLSPRKWFFFIKNKRIIVYEEKTYIFADIRKGQRGGAKGG